MEANETGKNNLWVPRVLRYWWVNHKRTGKQEVQRGYLWCPLREANGARSQFYQNMRRASAGDAVLSYIGGHIRHVGLILDSACPAPKPSDFSGNWHDDGWLLPVQWWALPDQVQPKEKIAEIGPFLPEKYSPINRRTGSGNQKAYLTEINQEVFEILTGISHFQAVAFPMAFAVAAATIEQVEDAVQTKIINDPGLDSTTKQNVILARRGQGLFRKRIYEFESACRLTQVTTPYLLTASHIKPWRVCTSAAERLDGANGLLLTPNADRLFDRGYIGFNDDGSLLLSPKLHTMDLQRLGLSPASLSSSFHDRQAAYLDYHRAHVFLQ